MEEPTWEIINGIRVIWLFWDMTFEGLAGLSMNILRAGDESPVQERFFQK